MPWLLRLVCLLGLALPAAALSSAALAQAPAAADPELAASQATTRKLNAYVALLNRTLRASESIARYDSWVDMKNGPTGRERIIYGLYGLYDVRGEIEKARAAVTAPPAMPALDAAVDPYISAYQALAPAITEAEGYYERQDYKVDKMQEGKALHARIAPAAEAFLRERATVDALFKVEKARADAAELALIETREGRKGRWQVAHVMIRAREVMDRLPSETKPVADMPAFDAALASFGAAVKDFDTFAAETPGALSPFESRPRSLLGRLREFRDKLGKAGGDARRGAGQDLTWIVNDYNTMTSMAQMVSHARR